MTPAAPAGAPPAAPPPPPAAGARNFPRKRKRSRWNQDSLEQKTVIPGMPTVIPPGLTREQERAYIGNGFGGKNSGFGGHRPRVWGQNTGFVVRSWSLG
uniref:Uncharacterized protein n=1 Tax=Malurus cyaneus samueli TaxID=2593467 RepID=A0A8C5TJL1_9PASS